MLPLGYSVDYSDYHILPFFSFDVHLSMSHQSAKFFPDLGSEYCSYRFFFEWTVE